ncbi:hypothetical protein [Dickeya zeae]
MAEAIEAGKKLEDFQI